MPNEFNIKNGFISKGDSIIYGSLTANTIYGGTIYGDGSQLTPPSGLTKGSFGINISNGNNVINLGQKGFVKMPYNGIITSWTLMTSVSGSVSVDIWKDSTNNFPPTISDSIVNGNYLNLNNEYINSENNLSGWTTTSFVEGDIFTFNVISASTLTNMNLTINVTKN
jgi:hypothetical protein